MRSTATTRTLLAAATAAAGLAATLAGAAAARAQQINTLDPSGRTENPPAIPPQGQPPPPPPAAGEGAVPSEEERYYATDGSLLTDPDADERQSLHHIGQTPDVHVVRRGDTLWDLCGYYFNNPWDWPKVWALNPSITNPHWIYPGDLVRLMPAGAVEPAGEPTAEPGPNPSTGKIARVGGGPAPSRKNVSLRQVAFVNDEEMQYAGTIIGSPEEKEMLWTGDEVYIDYPEGKPPQVGQRYAVYSDPKPIKHPETKARVGAYVALRGEVKITEVKKGRRARGVIVYVTDVIERGQKVGPGRTQFREVAPTAAERDLEGVIIAILATDQLIGDRQVVFVDRGSDDGLKVGNTMRILRRGDAKRPTGPGTNAGLDDRRYPDEDLGTIVIVETGKKSSIAFVYRAKQEIEIGDHVLMRQ